MKEVIRYIEQCNAEKDAQAASDDSEIKLDIEF